MLMRLHIQYITDNKIGKHYAYAAISAEALLGLIVLFTQGRDWLFGSDAKF